MLILLIKGRSYNVQLSFKTFNQRNFAGNKICYQAVNVNRHLTGHSKNGLKPISTIFYVIIDLWNKSSYTFYSSK